MTFHSVLIDVILLIAIGLSVYFSARRGFVRTFAQTVGFITATVLTLTISTPLANITYDKLIEPPILKMVSQQVDAVFENTLSQVPDIDVNSEEYNSFKENIGSSVSKVFEQLPNYVKNYINQAGIEPNDILPDDTILHNDDLTIEQTVQKFAKDISQNTIKPPVVKVVSLFYSIIILILSLIIVKILATFLNKAFSFSIVGKLNMALGGICGLAKGLILALLICIVIYTFVSFTKNGFWIFTLNNIEKTFIFKNLLTLIKI